MAPISRSLAVVLALVLALAWIAVARALVGESVDPARPLWLPAETRAPIAPATDGLPGRPLPAETLRPATESNPTAIPVTTIAPASARVSVPAATAAPHATVPVGPATTAAPAYDLPAIAPEPGMPALSPPPTHE